MEKKNYSERVREIKNEVLNEIRDILGTDSRHSFSDPFFIHYVEGEVATTEICIAVEVYGDGMVCFSTSKKSSPTWEEEEMIDGETVYQYEPNSFFDILDNLKKEIREKKLNTLRELVRKAGGSISFDGSFTFTGVDARDCGWMETVCEDTRLTGISLKDGKIEISDIWDGDDYTNSESFFETHELDRIIEYVRKQTEKSPEERLALTDEQKDAVAEFVKAFKKLEEMKVGIIMDDDKRLFGVNMTEVDSFQSSYYMNDIDDKESYHEVKHDAFPFGEQFFDYYLYSDESLYVKFK